MNRAFVLSRPRDFPIAQACVERLTGFGWHARVLVDPSEWDVAPEGTVSSPYAPLGRMVGLACHQGIMDGILDHSEHGDIVAKFDCDIRISRECSDWLQEARGGARSLRLGSKGWGGFWSAPRSQVAAVRVKSEDIRPCNCPESSLMGQGFHATSGRHEYHPELVAVKWIPGSSIKPNAGAWTLPANISMRRSVAGIELFDRPDAEFVNPH
jgi:hypothetical protein